MKRKTKRWWKIWLLTRWHHWVCVRYYGGTSPALFSTKTNALAYFKIQGFSYKKFCVLPEGQRPKRRKP